MAEERLGHTVETPWTGEHLYRYDEIKQYIGENDRVLDIACGTGYGTNKISTYTRNTVIGGDIEAEAVAICKQTWNRPNLEFRVLDGTALPFEDGYFDKLVSFETIEHTTEFMKMLKEFNRVVKPGGLLIISTPNFLINSPKGYITNPYHTQEWVLEELRGILNSVFSDVKIFGQRYSRYDNKSVSRTGKVVESFLKIKGVRKMPISWKNKLSRFFIKKNFYPQADDFRLVTDEKEIVKCTTFFCLCRKK